MVDDMDFYRDNQPQNQNQYLYDGEWKDMKVMEETIKLRGIGIQLFLLD